VKVEANHASKKEIQMSEHLSCLMFYVGSKLNTNKCRTLLHRRWQQNKV